jgi:hypothetical protein
VFQKHNTDLNYLEKFLEKHFSKQHLDASESAKNTFFCDVIKVDGIKNCSISNF